MRPYGSGWISSPAGPATIATCVPSMRGRLVERCGVSGTRAGEGREPVAIFRLGNGRLIGAVDDRVFGADDDVFFIRVLGMGDLIGREPPAASSTRDVEAPDTRSKSASLACILSFWARSASATDPMRAGYS